MTIKEAAEKYYNTPYNKAHNPACYPANEKVYTDIITHYESLMKAEGYEMVKTEEWIRLHGELAGANEYIKLLEENLMQGMKKIESEKQQYGEGFKD